MVKSAFDGIPCRHHLTDLYSAQRGLGCADVATATAGIGSIDAIDAAHEVALAPSLRDDGSHRLSARFRRLPAAR